MRFACVAIMQYPVWAPTNLSETGLGIETYQRYTFFPALASYCSRFALFRSHPSSIDGVQKALPIKWPHIHCGKFLRKSDGSAKLDKFIRDAPITRYPFDANPVPSANLFRCIRHLYTVSELGTSDLCALIAA